MIELLHATKKLGNQIVLNDINARFEEGKIIGIVGRNGSGKSMLFRLLCGLIYPTKGQVLVNGIDLKKQNAFPLEVRALIERPHFIDNMTGFENLSLLASMQKKIGSEEIERYLKLFHLDHEKNKPVSKYSLGMKQKLGIIQVLMEDADVMILDEPFSGLDKESVKEVKKILKKERSQNKTILIASHIESDIDDLCDEVYEMDTGKLSKSS